MKTGGLVRYWGSVRFFKHLILGTALFLILFSSGTAWYYGLACHKLRGNAGEASNALDLQFQGPAYEQMYPELYAECGKEEERVQQAAAEKVIYLTFQGETDSAAVRILDTLKAYGVKATFFVDGTNTPEAKKLYRRMDEEGHTVGVSNSAQGYKKIYQSVEAYLDSFAAAAQTIEEATGKKLEIFRFPGGSINAYNRSVQQELVLEMARRGYVYYDWDVDAGDQTAKSTAAEIRDRVVSRCSGLKQATVLMHGGGKGLTAEALPEIIGVLAAEGYQFSALNREVVPVHFDTRR